jgi:hypothetical protein
MCIGTFQSAAKNPAQAVTAEYPPAAFVDIKPDGQIVIQVNRTDVGQDVRLYWAGCRLFGQEAFDRQGPDVASRGGLTWFWGYLNGAKPRE